MQNGLVDDQRFAFQRHKGNGMVEVTFEGANHVSIALRDRDYNNIYQHMLETRAYNVKMLDGALIQMMYEYSSGILQSHRLAYFPSPYLEEFQNNPDIYLTEELFADIVARNVVPFPLRFDYASQEQEDQALGHPKAHLTLGQYINCRIPVTAPMTPVRFTDFILRNFYHTAFSQHAEGLPTFSGSFGDTILPSERKLVHVVTST